MVDEKQAKYEKKWVAALHAALQRGEAHGAKLRRIGQVMGLAGFFVAIYGMLVYLPGKDGEAYASVIAIALGAYFAGFANFFSTAGVQWPVLSRFVDRGRVEEAVRGSESR